MPRLLPALLGGLGGTSDKSEDKRRLIPVTELLLWLEDDTVDDTLEPLCREAKVDPKYERDGAAGGLVGRLVGCIGPETDRDDDLETVRLDLGRGVGS